MIYNILGRLSCGPKFWTKNGFEIDFNGVWSTSIDLSTENIFDSIFSIAAIWHLFQGDGWSKAACLTTDKFFVDLDFLKGKSIVSNLLIQCFLNNFILVTHPYLPINILLNSIAHLLFLFQETLTVLKKVLLSWHGKARPGALEQVARRGKKASLRITKIQKNESQLPRGSKDFRFFSLKGKYWIPSI